MRIVLGAWTAVFTGLLSTYVTVRFHVAGAAPFGALPIALPAVNAAVAVVSTLTLQWGLLRIRRGHALELAAALIATLVLGLLFAGMQGVLLWRLASAGAFASGTTLVQVGRALVVALVLQLSSGLVALAVLLVRSLDGRYGAARHQEVNAWGLYWAAVVGSWLVVFAVLWGA